MKPVIVLVALFGCVIAKPGITDTLTNTVSGAVNGVTSSVGGAVNGAINLVDDIPGVNATKLQELKNQLKNMANVTNLEERLEQMVGIDFDKLTPEEFLEQLDKIPGVNFAKNTFKLATDSLKFGWDMFRTHNNTEVLGVLKKHRDLLLTYVKIAGKSLWTGMTLGFSTMGNLVG